LAGDFCKKSPTPPKVLTDRGRQIKPGVRCAGRECRRAVWGSFTTDGKVLPQAVGSADTQCRPFTAKNSRSYPDGDGGGSPYSHDSPYAFFSPSLPFMRHPEQNAAVLLGLVTRGCDRALSKDPMKTAHDVNAHLAFPVPSGNTVRTFIVKRRHWVSALPTRLAIRTGDFSNDL
jgi:hypothetical protein